MLGRPAGYRIALLSGVRCVPPWLISICFGILGQAQQRDADGVERQRPARQRGQRAGAPRPVRPVLALCRRRLRRAARHRQHGSWCVHLAYLPGCLFDGTADPQCLHPTVPAVLQWASILNAGLTDSSWGQEWVGCKASLHRPSNGRGDAWWRLACGVLDAHDQPIDASDAGLRDCPKATHGPRCHLSASRVAGGSFASTWCLAAFAAVLTML